MGTSLTPRTRLQPVSASDGALHGRSGRWHALSREAVQRSASERAGRPVSGLRSSLEGPASVWDDRSAFFTAARAYLRPLGLVRGRVSRLRGEVSPSARRVSPSRKKRSRALMGSTDSLARSCDPTAHKPAASWGLPVSSRSSWTRTQISPRSLRVGSCSGGVSGLRGRGARFLSRSRDAERNEPAGSSSRSTSSRGRGTLGQMSPCVRPVGSFPHAVSGLRKKRARALTDSARGLTESRDSAAG